MKTKPKSNTSAGERNSGPAHTRDYDDAYGAGEARISQLRNDDGDYQDTKQRTGGRKAPTK